MRKRNLIIVTPFEHVQSIEDLDPHRFIGIIVSVKEWMFTFANITGHRLIVSNGSWQRHDHLHLKFEIEKNDIVKLLQVIPTLDQFKFRVSMGGACEPNMRYFPKNIKYDNSN
tara:strand:+ start:712 stop:1050 length:339 start_codon:yes stop_codon:yes gene_type:complete